MSDIQIGLLAIVGIFNQINAGLSCPDWSDVIALGFELCLTCLTCTVIVLFCDNIIKIP